MPEYLLRPWMIQDQLRQVQGEEEELSKGARCALETWRAESCQTLFRPEPWSAEAHLVHSRDNVCTSSRTIGNLNGKSFDKKRGSIWCPVIPAMFT